MEITLNNVKRFKYSDILGWSVSRYDKFLLCKRQYYYDYYNKFDKEFSREKITALKSMTSIPLEVGNIVHDSIKDLLERLLKTETPISPEKYLEYVRQKSEKYCGEKQFMEVYYKDREAVDCGEIFEAVKRSLNNFILSERYKWITEKAVTNKSGWVIEPPGFGETRICDYKAYCKVDFLFPVEGKLFILDWKTGKQDELKHKKQLVGYTAWASYTFGAGPDKINPITVYLQPEYKETSFVVNEQDIAELSTKVISETKEMYGFCKDIEKNIPIEKSVFTRTNSVKICRFCNYRELCGVKQDESLFAF